MVSDVLNSEQWTYLTDIKDDLRDSTLQNKNIVLRNLSKGSLVSGFSPDIWGDNYSNNTISDVLVSGQWFDTLGQNRQFVPGGIFDNADAQFLTHCTHRSKFLTANEVWYKVELNHSGTYVPVYTSGTNDFTTGESYSILGVKRLPGEYEVSIYLKIKKS